EPDVIGVKRWAEQRHDEVAGEHAVSCHASRPRMNLRVKFCECDLTTSRRVDQCDPFGCRSGSIPQRSRQCGSRGDLRCHKTPPVRTFVYSSARRMNSSLL